MQFLHTWCMIMLNHECFFSFFSLHICCFAASNELNFCVKSEIFECTRFIRLIPFFFSLFQILFDSTEYSSGWLMLSRMCQSEILYVYIFFRHRRLFHWNSNLVFFFLLFIKTEKCSSNYFITSDAHIGFIWWLHIYVYVNWHLSHDIGFSLVAQ